MMSRHAKLGIVFAVMLLGSQAVQAVPMLSLSSSPDPLTGLMVGDTITITVELSSVGDAAGGGLELLSAEVTWDGTLFGTATTPAAGTIVPDVLDFLSAGFDGSADATYDALGGSGSGAFIDSNGTFFSFDIMAEAVGTGTISFDALGTSAFDGDGNETVLSLGGALTFTIADAAAAAPEPASLALLGLGLAGLGFGTRRRRAAA